MREGSAAGGGGQTPDTRDGLSVARARQSAHKRGGMFARVIWRSLRQRWPRLLVAAVAVVLGGTLVAALTSLSLDMGSKLSKELRAYGANVVVSPRNDVVATGSGGLDFGAIADQSYLSESDLAVLDNPEWNVDIAGYASYLYGVVVARGQTIILAGIQFDRVQTVSPWWHVAGGWPVSGDERGALVGSTAAGQLGLAIGDELVVQYQGRPAALQVKGIVDTGAAEDNQVLVSLAAAQQILGRPGAIGLAQVSISGSRRPVADTVSLVKSAMPRAQVKIIGQIADAEANIFAKIQLLIGLVAVLVLVAAALSVGSTMTTTVLERTREIGLLKALGATNRRVAALFLAETAVIGLAGGLAGFAGGLLVAELIARNVFSASLAFQWTALPVTIGVSLIVAVAGSLMPLRRAVAVDPAITLRGE